MLHRYGGSTRIRTAASFDYESIALTDYAIDPCWSGRRESNSDRLGGSQVHYQSVTPALLGAATRNQTPDILLTSQALYHLSYNGKLAGTAGFEPATDRLTADCSTTELPRNI